jgi:GNAT superfamily N-acetyltransferase
MLRPIKISDEPLYKDFTYSLSEKSMFLRFASVRQDMLHERRQPAIVIDYSKEMAILAVTETNGREKILGIGQYYLNESSHIAEVAFAVLDEYQNKGIGTQLLDYIMYLAKNRGLIGLTASVLEENDPMIHVFRQAGFTVSGRSTEGIYKLTKTFRD